MRTFETGKAYSCSSVCDHNCVWTFEVVKRTDKTITLRLVPGPIGKGLTTSHRVTSYNDAELIYPLGKYSMAPILTA